MRARLTISEDRVTAVAKAFKSIGINAILKLEEADPQFRVALRLARAVGVNACCALMCLNATVSYMLTSPGEEYWNEFAGYAVKQGFKVESAEKAYALVASFLQACRGNRLFKPTKLKRLSLMRASGLVDRIYSQYEAYARDLEGLRRDLASSLRASASAKTIVFAVKMFYYAFRAATGRGVRVPLSIPIPIDRRIAWITILSGMVSVPQPFNASVARLVRRREVAQKAWNMVASFSGIPPINLDAPLWLLGKAVRGTHRVKLGVEALNSLWRGYVDYALINNLVHELFYLKR